MVHAYILDRITQREMTMKLYFGLLLCFGWLILATAQDNGLSDSGVCSRTALQLLREGCPRSCIARDGESQCPICNATCASGGCISLERLVSVLGCRRDCVIKDEETGCLECDETCVNCPVVLCDVFCSNGYEHDEDTGCQTCECVESCPVTASELVAQDECSRLCIIESSSGCPMCDPECVVSDVEPDCRTDDDCVEGEICVTVGNFGVAECVDVPSEGDSCSVEDNDDGELDETELEKLFAMDRISGVVERALVSLVGSMEESCADGFRCSSEGTCEPIEGNCISDPSMPSCDDEGNYRPLQCNAVEGVEGTYLCYCVHPNGTQVPDTERRITEKENVPDCVGIVFDPCKYTLNGQEYAARHGEDVVDFTRCVRCRCRDGELVGCVDTDANECDAIDDEDEPEECEFMGRLLAHRETVKVDECNVCGCRDGEVSCTELECDDDDSREEEDGCKKCRRLARRRVCGVDGRTHLSRCFAQNCSGLREVDILDAPCHLQDICRQNPCSRGLTCLRRGGVTCLRRDGCVADALRHCVNTTLLRCRNSLSDIDETVCASNGQSYASVCHMLQDTSMVQVEHAGRCDNPECDTGPVCGTDGVTYRNLCVLRSRSANARVDHRGECDEEDETPSDEICARVRATGRCEYNRDNCDRLVRPEEGCCPICGGVAQIALDRSRLQAYAELNPGVATLDDFVESLARAGFFPDGLDDQCEVEISLTRRSNMEIVLRARSASDEDACFQASEMLVERANDPALALSTVPPELEFTSGAASAPLVEDGGSGASAAAFSYLTLAIACGLTQSFF